MNESLIFSIGGLILFIYAIKQLSQVLGKIFTQAAKDLIKKFTKNIFSALLIGCLLTFLLQSSSAVIILAIVFINAQSLTFKQAIGIIMGANIGTTFSSQLIALDIMQYSIFPLVVGLAILIFSKNEKSKNYGEILFYFGLLFFGLFIIQQSVLPLKESDLFETWMTQIEDRPVRGALVGGLITLIIQSSSSTIGMAIIMGKQNLISMATGIAIMLGAELGTCSDTLIATINGSRQAIKAGIFHVMFNLITIIIGLLLFYPFVSLINFLSVQQGIDHQIANAHMLFNVVGVLLFLPFVGWSERCLNFLLPEKGKGATKP